MWDLTQQEKVLLVFGGAISSIAMFFDIQLRTQAEKHQKKQSQIRQWQENSNKTNYYKVLEGQQNKESTYNVVIQKVYPNIFNDTLLIRERQLPLHVGKNEVYHHVTGGSFTFKDKSKEVQADINDATVISTILSYKKQQVRVFGHMQPVVNRVQYFLKKSQGIAIVGMLSYDIATHKFRIQPMVMGLSINQIIDYYHNNYLLFTVPRFFTLGLFLIGIWMSYKPFKKFIRKILNKIPFMKRKPTDQEVQQSQCQVFKQKIVIKTKQDHVYECMKCGKNNTQIIYRCGHLSICQKCHEQNLSINGKMTCPSCHKDSEGDLKIFFG